MDIFIDKKKQNRPDLEEQIETEFQKIKTYNYRPFDLRFLYWNTEIIERSREENLNIYLNEKVPAILTGRAAIQIKTEHWNSFGYTEILTDTNYFTRGGCYCFPIYANIKENKKKTKRININQEFTNILKRSYGIKDLLNETVFYYCIGILNSSEYRSRYQELLKYSFPKIPFLLKYDLFSLISEYGYKIANIFNLNAESIPSEFYGTFPNSGKDLIESIKINSDFTEIWINSDQFFGNVNRDIISIQIGGYKILERWLNERKNRKLAYDDISYFTKLIGGLKMYIKTIIDIDKILHSELTEIQRNQIIFN